MNHSMQNLRREFKKAELLEKNLPENPVELLLNWYQQAVDSQVPDPNAMSLATLDADGFPVSRIVLLKEASTKGLSFFTNYQSAKGHEIAAHPLGSLQFFWSPIERQIRVRGHIEKVSASESDAYFASRPRESQISAWVSKQSETVSSREFLEREMEAWTQKFSGLDAIPRPPHWGGYRLLPNQFEFWQGRPSRLHDRLQAKFNGRSWGWTRLSP